MYNGPHLKTKFIIAKLVRCNRLIIFRDQFGPIKLYRRISFNWLPFLIISVHKHANHFTYSITTVLYYCILYMIIIFSSG